MRKLISIAVVMLSLCAIGRGQTVNLNYSSASPAAPSGSVNVTWQYGTGTGSNPTNLSAYVPLPSLMGVGAPTSVCSATVNKGYFYISDALATYQCSNLVGSVYQWNLLDRKSTRLNSSHLGISYAVFC